MAYTEQTRGLGKSLGGMLGALVVIGLVVIAAVVITMLPEHARKEAALFRAGLPADRDVPHAGDPAVLRLPGRLRARWRGIDLRPDRLLPRHVQADRVLQLRSAHLGAGGRESRAGLHPDFHLHGRGDGAQRHRQRAAVLRAGAAQARARRARARRHHHGNDPRRDDRNHRRVGDDDDRARAADHDAAGLQPRARLRHDCGCGNARDSDPAEHHADHHGRPARRFGRASVLGGTRAGADARRALPAVHLHRVVDLAAARSAAAARASGRAEGPDDAAALARLLPAGVPDRHDQVLDPARLGDAERGGSGRRVRSAAARDVRREAQLQDAGGELPYLGPHRRDGVLHHHQRDVLCLRIPRARR